MSEEIIIDGVDVSECGFLDNHLQTKLLLCNECDSDFAAMECKDDPNCYYKQLKRLEFENKLLKADYEASEAENAKLKELLEMRCYSEIEFENKKLKEKLETLQDVLLKIKDIAICGGDCEQDCDHCMQGQIHQLIKEALNGKED